MYNISDLNEKQMQIAKDTEGAILVTAGAGSGKTRLLTHRICYIIESGKAKADNILAITFTNKATREMQERLIDMSPTAAMIWISTFHAMCVKILRDNIQLLDGYNKYFTICDETDKKKIIKSIAKELNIDKEDTINKFTWHISQAKNEGLSVQEYCKQISFDKDVDKIFNFFNRYEEEMKNSNSLDFDDLLYKTLVLFEQFPEVLQRYQMRFKYILVDEFQDTNVVQYKLVKLLSAYWHNIFVVGDEDQCIYTWRGANIDNIKNYIREFDNVKIYKLEQNYRSTKNIIEKANLLIKHNTSRIEKTLYTENEEGERVVYNQANDEYEEAEYVARTIHNLVGCGVRLNQIGVLMRISALSRLIEEKLLNYNIPYIVSGIFKFFDRLEIKNVLAYLRLIINPKDNTSCIRIINYPKRSIGQASIDKLSTIARSNGKSILEVILDIDDYPELSKLKVKTNEFAVTMKELMNLYQDCSLSEFVKTLINKFAIIEQYNTGSDEDIDRKANIEQLQQSIKTFEENNPEMGLLEYLESVSLENSIEESNADGNNVSVSTVHASKGLEYDYVFIIGLEDGSFPLSRAFDNPDDMEEERRLMYVAVTRARKKLYITRAKSRFLYGVRSVRLESRFIKEMNMSAIKMKQEILNSNNNYSYNQQYNNKLDTNYNNSYSANNSFYQTKPTNNMGNFATEFGFVYNQNNKATQANKFSDYKIGVTVFHSKFGVGKIIEIERNGDNTYAVCQFDTIGVKKLALDFAPLKILKK